MSDERSRTLIRQVTLALMLLATGVVVQAQEPGHLNVKTVVQKEEITVGDDGVPERKLVPVETVIPGDAVVYTITFRNISDEAADNVVITNPIADSLTYVDGSAFGPGTEIQFSVDGGQNFAIREELTVTEDGVERAAGAKDYTHIRWVMHGELAVGAQGVARFSAVLD